MGPDRQERHDALVKHEDKLTNGHRGDVDAMSDAIVDQSRALRVMLKTDFVKQEVFDHHLKVDCPLRIEKAVKKHGCHPVNWPVVAMAFGLIIAAMKLFGKI